MRQLAESQPESRADEEPSWDWRRDWWGLAYSLLIHVAILVLLLLWVQPRQTGQGPMTFQGKFDGEQLDQPAELDMQQAALSQQWDQVSVLDQEVPLPVSPNVAQRATRPVVLPEVSMPGVVSDAPIAKAPNGGGLSGRRAEDRARLVQQGGGNDASEQAVDLALIYLSKHQRRDGRWQFQHGADCTCRNPGYNATDTAATGLALLAFLGRNHNHVDKSQYQETVLNGLNFLLTTSKDGDLTMLTEMSMYGQGIATLALAEAYAISKDPALKKPTQEAVDFIVQAQHPLGGWRYVPGQIGDLNVTGWQLMALKTARLAGLEVPDQTLQRAKSFVDSQATSVGYLFSYPGTDPTVGQPVPSAIGILLRMYEGWGPGRDEIRDGAKYLLGRNVSNNHIYFNYYATMVLFHYGGEEWKTWNPFMREYLINTQELLGHERGSWYFEHPKTGEAGGRLFNTVMAVMILEVYYRHLRLYEEDALQRDFPLE